MPPRGERSGDQEAADARAMLRDAAIITATRRDRRDGPPAEVAATVLRVVAEWWAEEARRVTDERRMGHKTTSAQLTQARAYLVGIAQSLDGRTDHPDNVWPGQSDDYNRLIGGDNTGEPIGVLSDIPGLQIKPDVWQGLRDKISAAADAMVLDSPEAQRAMRDQLAAAGLPIVGQETKQEESAPTMQFVDPAPAGALQRPRMSFPEVREHASVAGLNREHRSVSQVYSFSECGVRYALRDMDVPTWWNIGGTAAHAACAETLRGVTDSRGVPGTQYGPPSNDDTRAALWAQHFSLAIAAKVTEPGCPPMSQWRTANRGTEGYDWWRVEGPRLLSNFARWLDTRLQQGWRVAVSPDQFPMIELELILNVTDESRVIPVKAIPDLVLDRPAPDGTPQYLIVDFKAGGSEPVDTFQLGVYAWAVNAVLGGDEHFRAPATIDGEYVMLRTGESLPAPALLDLHSRDELEYRVVTMDRAERQGLYLVNRSRSCRTCGVADLCPVGPR